MYVRACDDVRTCILCYSTASQNQTQHLRAGITLQLRLLSSPPLSPPCQQAQDGVSSSLPSLTCHEIFDVSPASPDPDPATASMAGTPVLPSDDPTHTHWSQSSSDGFPTEMWSADDFVLQRLVDAMEQRLREIKGANYDKTDLSCSLLGSFNT